MLMSTATWPSSLSYSYMIHIYVLGRTWHNRHKNLLEWNETYHSSRKKKKKPTCNWNVERMTKKTCFWNTYRSSTLRTTSNWSGGLFTWIKCQTFSVAMIERNSIFPVSTSRLTNEPRFFHVNCPVAIDSSFFPWTNCLKLLHRFR